MLDEENLNIKSINSINNMHMKGVNNILSRPQVVLLAILLSIACIYPAHSKIRLPKLISDGMVLQRDAEVRIWGWANRGEAIKVTFLGEEHAATTDDSGHWEVLLKDLKAGGPHKMVIKGKNTIKLDNILIGDVWICAGQSNMQHDVKTSRALYKKEIAQSANSFIRHFKVPHAYDFNGPQEDIKEGSWVEASPETVLSFSAVAYFFGDALYKKYKIPIGLVHASYGGSPAQAWVSKEKLKEFPDHYKEALKYGNQSLVDSIVKAENDRKDKWFKEVNEKDEGYVSWWPNYTSMDSWESMKLPGYFSVGWKGESKGAFWFTKEIEIPEAVLNNEVTMKLGRVSNFYEIYINGKHIATNWWSEWVATENKIAPGILKAGKNTIFIRVTNSTGDGAFFDGEPFQIVSDWYVKDISGDWKFKQGCEMEELPWQTQFHWASTSLYNAMLSPLTNYTMKGVIWYQGEGNSGKPKQYASLFPTLIQNWREEWNQGDFPFLFVQLANFMAPANEPKASNWAMLRDSQRKTLSLSNTGMAVAIDVGEEHDVHPKNKKDVGYRLALEAQRVAYGETDVVSTGPLFLSEEIVDNQVVLTFETYGSKLKTKEGEALKYFAIAGEDQKFVWAEARIEGDKVVVHSPEVENPVAVRYAWADNPVTANLINEEDLPASPFRTDNWEE